MIVLTLPIVLPVVLAAGFDKLWFGIFLILTIEMAQISPPVAFNLFVIQNITGDLQTYVAWKVIAVLPDHDAVHGRPDRLPQIGDLARRFHPVEIDRALPNSQGWISRGAEWNRAR